MYALVSSLYYFLNITLLPVHLYRTLGEFFQNTEVAPQAGGFLLPLVSVIGVIILLYDFGFEHTPETAALLVRFYDYFLFVVFMLLLLRVDYAGLIRKR